MNEPGVVVIKDAVKAILGKVTFQLFQGVPICYAVNVFYGFCRSCFFLDLHFTLTNFQILELDFVVLHWIDGHDIKTHLLFKQLVKLKLKIT